ncbi:MAG: FAD-dependent oxidoreductase [Clostridium sp.]|nr:FAD-dependent oxidoreductase [Clostridium sp.]
MKKINKELVIIGGGPAGLAAALEAERLGLKEILILERNDELGGILEQCIHDGFGINRFKKQLSGPQYAQMFIDELEDSDIEVKLNTMVLEITKDKVIYAINSSDGITEIHAKAVILAMGCRERTQKQVFILGTRPSGIMTAGTAQRYMNIEGLIPGKKAVILGSGDIGMIMARRMTLEGMEVEGVYEVMESPGGLARNVFQCLDDYDIPLHLSTTVTKVKGNHKLEGVTVQKVDENRNPIEGTEREIDCDLLILSVGLIPENELSVKAGVKLSKVTKGPIVDNNMMTNVKGIFAAGNVVNVFDLADYVSDTGEIAARGAYNYINKELEISNDIEIIAGDNVNFLIPNTYKIGKKGNLSLYFRTKTVIEKAKVSIWQNDKEIYKKIHQIVRPQEMVLAHLDEKLIEEINDKDPIVVKLSKVGA